MLNYVYSSDLTLGNSLFDAVKLVKTTDIVKYEYSGYGIGFDMERTFGLPATGFGRNVINFGADMDSSVHMNNKKIYFSSLYRSQTRIRYYNTGCRKNVFN